MLEVAEAQRRLIALHPPLDCLELPLADAIGGYLAADIIARRSSPAADLSAMDGYAVRYADLPGPLEYIGESAAGSPFSDQVGPGQCTRIFTGAHLPDGADTILIQEEARQDGISVLMTGEGPPRAGSHIRKAGSDFAEGDILLQSGAHLHAGAVALAAMGNYGRVTVRQKPKIAIISSGDELVLPGTECRDHQIPSANNLILRTLLAALPCEIVDHGIIADDQGLLTEKFRQCTDADIIVTSGGASVGDHDLIRPALEAAGADIDFWRVALRPGKPLMAGMLGRTVILGLPGNPASAFVTAFLFLLPLVRHLAGAASPFPETIMAKAGTEIGENGQRTQYLRAKFDGEYVTPFSSQDSGLVSPLSDANALIVRAPSAPGVRKGDTVFIHQLPV